MLANAGSQSTKGVEVETLFYPVEGLTINAAATYLDPVFDSFTQSAIGDISGQRPSGIPEWTVIVGAQYEFDLGNALLVPRANFLWQSETQLVEGLPDFLVRAPDGTILDATAAIAAAAPFTREVNDLTASLTYEHDAGFSISVWGRNLLDDRSLGTIFPSPAQPRSISGYANDPRTYGVTGRYRF